MLNRRMFMAVQCGIRLPRRGQEKYQRRCLSSAKRRRSSAFIYARHSMRFVKNIEISRDQLKQLLSSIKKQKKRIVGYAATSKSTTVTNFCGITPDLVEFISDTTPIKQGKFTPGAHIPVLSYQEFSDNYPDYALLFAWNHIDEIMAKEQRFAEAGGKWITYIPKVRILK